MAKIQKITPCLWFDREAEDAVKYYTSIFKNSGIGRISRYPAELNETDKNPTGRVLTVEFWLEEQSFLALNGGPVFKFNEAISFTVYCDLQEEIDYYWEKLCDGGEEKAQMCGWLKDKFGVSWQIVPTVVPELLTNPNVKKTESVFSMIMQMKKIDIAALQKAFDEA